MMVEKGDIAEELTRLSHHLDEIDKAAASKEAAGKKLDNGCGKVTSASRHGQAELLPS